MGTKLMTVSNTTRLSAGVPLDKQRHIAKALTILNPEYANLQKLAALGKKVNLRRVPEHIRGWTFDGNTMTIPRGFTAQAAKIIGLGMSDIGDYTRVLPEVEFPTPKFELNKEQQTAVANIAKRRFATLQSPTGSGKTIMALELIRIRRQPALVIVHTTALLNQWVERAEQMLGIHPREIGVIGQGEFRIGDRLTIGLVQTLRKHTQAVAPHIGHLIVDECHHTPATTFTETVTAFDSRYALGLSATHVRRDGLTPLIYWYVGPLVHTVQRKALIKAGHIVDIETIIRHTKFEPSPYIDPVWEREKLIRELIQDPNRNTMIALDAIEEARKGPCIVITDRVHHAEILADIISNFGVAARACHGKMPKEEQQYIIDTLGQETKVVVATGQLLGEGFDCKQLVALLLAMPITFTGRLIQYIGRVARSAPGKHGARVYDYHDVRVPVLMKAARGRLRTYNAMKAEIHDE